MSTPPFAREEKTMKRLAVVLIAVGSLAGCVAYPVEGGYGHYPYHDRYGYGERERGPVGHSERQWQPTGERVARDRDGDGVPNRYDRRPDDPRRR
jgi:hypothetical protein